MRLIVGLGNPGKDYENTRHNVGFLLVDALAQKLGLAWQTDKKLQAEIAKGGEFMLVKPLTYMNNSGKAVKAVMLYYKLMPKKFLILKTRQSDLSSLLTVIHDDLDIGLGKYKISIDSRSAGHKGVESIIKYLKTKNFKRWRIGIHTNIMEKTMADLSGRKPAEAAKFVLNKFNSSELIIIHNLIRELLKLILPT